MNIVLFFSEHGLGKLGPPGEHPSTTLRKLYITNPEKQAKHFLLWNLRFFNHSRRLSQILLAVQQVYSDTFNKTAFYLSGETFWWRDKLWKKNPIQFSTFSLEFERSQQKLFRQAFKATYCWSGRSFWDFLVPFRKVSSKYFSELERKTIGFTGKILEMVAKTALCISRRYIQGSVYIWQFDTFLICGFGAIQCRLFRDRYRQMHSCCVLRAQRNNLCLFEQNNLLIFSDIERETVKILGKFLLQECWNWKVFVRENQFIKAYYCNSRTFINSKKKLKRTSDA